MYFIGIKIAHGGTRAMALDLKSSVIRAEASVKRQADEIARAFGAAPGLIELAGQAPGVKSAAECLWLKQHEANQELMSRQQYLVDTLHPAGFL